MVTDAKENIPVAPWTTHIEEFLRHTLPRSPFLVVDNTRANHRNDSRLYGLVEGDSSSADPTL
jgi:hypothetical protein